ncbi:hypothetical protein [Streptomyces sp. NPDC051569]|uniref:hypothetical protein n=1 Tax=Streptomyces sp. NPDC051569 TaxID=3365661 RepID=UPI0037B6A269
MPSPAITPMPHVSRAYWCEQVTYRSMDADGIVNVSRRPVASPADAVRGIRTAVRALDSTLAPMERHRALSWVDGAGCVGAIATLHRGEPCGFSLSYRGRWIEWTVRPFFVFRVARESLLPLLPTSPCAAAPTPTPSPAGPDVRDPG